MAVLVAVALLAGACLVLAYQDWQRTTRDFFRRADLYVQRSERRVEDFYWAHFRVWEAAEAELLYVDRVIESYVNGTAEIERPREASPIRVLNMKEVI
jgi:hypothetical protein